MASLAHAVRAELPALGRETYLNAGGAGPLPRAVVRAIVEQVERSLERGRMGLEEITAMEQARSELRSEVAALLGAEQAEIALTTSVTDGLGRVIWGIDWREGDEAITTSLEHPGLVVPLMTAARRYGVRVRIIALETGGEDLAASVAELAGPRTRLVALSHVAWTTGARLDVEGAAKAAHDAGALVLVDGAQGAGAIRSSPRALGADAYALPAQKWLLGPGGLGALWVADEALDCIDITLGGFGSGTDHRSDGRMRPHPDARRLEPGMLPDMLVAGWTASLRWLAGLRDSSTGDAAGWPLILGQAAGATARARAAIEMAGARVLTPAPRQAGLLTFTLDGVDPEAACADLERRGVVLRGISEPPALRASIGFFTDPQDIARLAEALAGVIG